MNLSNESKRAGNRNMHKQTSSSPAVGLSTFSLSSTITLCALKKTPIAYYSVYKCGEFQQNHHSLFVVQNAKKSSQVKFLKRAANQFISSVKWHSR
jgi:hypothetical protein